MKKIIMIVMCVVMSGLMVAPAEAVVTCPDGSVAGGTAPSYAECNLAKPEDDDKSLWEVVNNILNVILAVLGVATVCVIIYGGINLLISQGDPSKIKRGKDAILYGLIGLLIALLAFAIVNFVLTSVFSGGGETEAP